MHATAIVLRMHWHVARWRSAHSTSGPLNIHGDLANICTYCDSFRKFSYQLINERPSSSQIVFRLLLSTDIATVCWAADKVGFPDLPSLAWSHPHLFALRTHLMLKHLSIRSLSFVPKKPRTIFLGVKGNDSVLVLF